MSANPLDDKKRELRALIDGAMLSLYGLGCEYEITRPRLPAHGELSASAALRLAGLLKRPPLEIAAEIAAALPLSGGERVEPAGKGFLNFFLKPDFLLAALSPSPKFNAPPLPPLEDAGFAEAYPKARLAAVLETQGAPPDGSQRLELLTSPEELRLLWAVFGGDRRELIEAALDFYDKIGLRGGRPLAMARYILLGNALSSMEVTQ